VSSLHGDNHMVDHMKNLTSQDVINALDFITEVAHLETVLLSNSIW
jgi:hypothetical protein